MVEDTGMTRLRKWQDKFERAKSTSWEPDRFDWRDKEYLGNNEVEYDSEPAPGAKRKLARNVQNINYEFIESTVDTSIPNPGIQAKHEDKQPLAKMIEDSAKSDLDEWNIAKTNDETERTTAIHGWSIFEVMWNPDKKTSVYTGEIIVKSRHPKTFIGQPKVYNVQDMDYYFTITSMSKAQAKRRYGVDLSGESESIPEANQNPQNEEVTDDDTISILTAWYKDEETGAIGKFTWCNEEVLEDLPDFYARRLKRCTQCGAVVYGDECEEMLPTGEVDEEGNPVLAKCGNTKTKESIEEYEEIPVDMMLSDGRVIPAGAQVPYYKPTHYPIVIRRNVPVAFQLGGASDIELIHD
jgi:hypothetical protein